MLALKRTIRNQPAGLMLGFTIASLLFLAAFGLAFSSGSILATHDASGNVHACINVYTGASRIMYPGQAPNCAAAEFLVEWPGTSVAGELEARLDALEEQVPDCLSEVAGDALFEGCNVRIQNGQGNTATVNGLGNLIVGYDENDFDYERGGSHNVVVGQRHEYTSYGGLVVGQNNRITGDWASVSGGTGNIASGNFSSVSGGASNAAEGSRASVSGGQVNHADGDFASVSGGSGNFASGIRSSVTGGSANTADAESATVSGGFTRSANGNFDWVAGTLLEDS